MIIITSKPGQLGNSVILYANFLAYGWEHNEKILNPDFYMYKNYFRGSNSQNSFINQIIAPVLFYTGRVLDKLSSKKIIALQWDERVDLDTNSWKKKQNIILVQGWNYRGNKTLEKHKQQIKEFFTPVPEFLNRLNEWSSKNFRQNTVKVGIHIRRGDYIRFEDGKYFYSHEQYKNFMMQVLQILPDKTIQFIVASNEMIKTELFNFPKNEISLAPGHELLDLYALSKCDFLIGPPSTYTMWASFYGNVPLCMMHDAGKKISKTDFVVQTTF